jgi:Tfp pilus assembly PilM family ATPase
MNFFQQFNVSTLAGLTLRQDRMSMIKVSHSQQKIKIEAFAVTNATEEWFVDGKINQKQNMLRAIRHLAKSANAEHCYVAIGLPVSQVIQKRIRLTAGLNDAEREADIIANLAHHLPGLNEALSFDYSCLAQYEREDEFLLVAARRELINTYNSIAIQANLKPRIIDIDIYALARTAALMQKSGVFLDLDILHGQLVLLEKGEVLAIQQILINVDEDELIKQLKRGLQLFCSTLQCSQIEKILLTGKKEYFSKLNEVLSQKMGIELIKDSVFQFFDISEQINKEKLYEQEPELLAALGLTLREFPRW